MPKLYLLVTLVGLASALSVSPGNTTTEGCAGFSDCRRCAGHTGCVWCGIAKECRSGNLFGAHDACADYHWSQCLLPQYGFITLCIAIPLLVCLLCIICCCFRKVCCPRHWGSKLPAWQKVRQQYDLQDDDEIFGPVRANPVTGQTAAETRATLRTKYTELGLQPNF